MMKLHGIELLFLFLSAVPLNLFTHALSGYEKGSTWPFTIGWEVAVRAMEK